MSRKPKAKARAKAIKKPVVIEPAFDIHQHAMLLTLHTSLWSGYKTAREASQETAALNKAESDVVATFKKLLPKHALQAHKVLRNRATVCFYKWSLPWANDGQRIILNTALLQFEAEMRKIKAEWDEATRDFVDAYPKYLAAAPKRLGTLFKREDYPEPEHVGKRFALSTTIVPVPAAQDFRVTLSDAHLNRIRQQINDDVNAALQQAIKNVWQRMFTVVEKMAVKLRDYKVSDDGKEGIFRDSLVTNITELLELVPALNVTNDAQVNSFAKQVQQQLTRYDADALRTDDNIRGEVAQKAQAILDKMGDFL